MVDVTLFDHNMEFVRDLTPNRKSQGKAIYQVGLEGSLYIMKIVSTRESYQIDREELLKERDVLERARGIENITNLLNFYDHVPEYVAILKEYAEGDELKGLNRPFDKNGIKKRLHHTITAFHDRGIAGLDPHKENIIISPDGKQGTFNDFNIAYFREECTADFFESLKKRDYTSLRSAFK